MIKDDSKLIGVEWSMTRQGHLCATMYIGKDKPIIHRTVRLDAFLDNKIRYGDHITWKKGDGRYNIVGHRSTHTYGLPVVVPTKCINCKRDLVKIVQPINNRKNSASETRLMCTCEDSCTTAKMAMWYAFSDKIATGVKIPLPNRRAKLLLDAGYWTPFSFYAISTYTALMNIKLNSKEIAKMDEYIKALPRRMTLSQLLCAMGYPTSAKKIEVIASHCKDLDALMKMSTDKIQSLDPRYSYTTNELTRMKAFWNKTTTKLNLINIRRHITIVEHEEAVKIKQLLKKAKIYLHTEITPSKDVNVLKTKLYYDDVSWVTTLEHATMVLVDNIKAKKRWEKLLIKKGLSMPVYTICMLGIHRYNAT